MFIHDAPYLGSLNGGARLRDSAVRLQHYLDVNPGNKARAAAFWENQKALAANPNGHPADGLFIGTGVRDIRIDCYTVLSSVRMGSAADRALWSEFCNAFIVANGGSVVDPLVFTKDLAPTASGATGTNLGFEVQVAGGVAPYTYAWTRNGSPIGTNKNTYGPATIQAGNHQCKVTDSEGTVINSTVCVVTVTPAA